MADENAPESGIADGSQPYAGWASETGSTTGTRHRKKKKRKLGSESPPLSINSLMDVVTILLVYLIKSYATSPVDVKDPAIKLPTSTSQENVEEAAVVMVTGPFRDTFLGDQVVSVENVPVLVIDGLKLFSLTKVAGADGRASFRIPSEQKEGQSATSFVIPSLKAELLKAKKTQEMSAEITNREFTGKVVILADKSTPYRVLMDLLVTCGQADFGEFKFAIVKDEG